MILLVMFFGGMEIKPVSGLEVKIITVVFSDSLSDGFHVQSAAADIAFRHATQRWPQEMKEVTNQTIWMPGGYCCQQQDTAAIMPMIAMDIQQDMMNRNGSTIFVAPGCTFQVMVLGDYARGNYKLSFALFGECQRMNVVPEFDVPVIATDATGAILKNAQRYPTLTAFPSIGINELVDAAKTILDLFGWKTMSVLCGDLSPGLIDDFVMGTCRVFNAVVGTAVGYQVTFTHFDWKPSPNRTETYSEMLRQIRLKSRVIIILARTNEVLRTLMILAHRLEMTNGEFIFLSLQVPAAPGRLDSQAMDWKGSHSSDDETYTAFQSLIVLRNPSTNWTNVPNLMAEITNHSRDAYNWTFTREEAELASDFIVAAYEAVISLLEALSQYYAEFNQPPISGRAFREKFINKTFDLPTRSFYIGQTGMRVCDVVFTRLNIASGKMEAAWYYNSATKSLAAMSPHLANSWRNRTTAPLNIPACGFTGDLCIGGLDKASVIGAIIGAAALLLLGCFTVTWRIQHFSRDFEKWWILEESAIVFLTNRWVTKRSIRDYVL